MLFSALSLKVLVGLGAVVGASVLSIHLKSKDTDTNTGTLNSKQGEAVVIPELDEPAIVPGPEMAVTQEQAAKKEIERLNKEIEKCHLTIANNESELLHIKLEISLLEQDVKAKETKHQENRVTWKDSVTIHEEVHKSEKNLILAQKEVEYKEERKKIKQ